jgi:hypothetical protein
MFTTAHQLEFNKTTLEGREMRDSPVCAKFHWRDNV